MYALRRPTKQDLRDSNLITQLALQTKMANEAGEISDETSQALLQVFVRAHSQIVARAGIWSRQKQRRYDAKHALFAFDSSTPFQLSVLVAVAVVSSIAWLLI